MPPKKKAKLTLPQWECKDGSKWITYADEDSALIEKAFQTSGSSKFTTTDLTFNKGFGTKYEFDFAAMTQINTDTNKSRPLRRQAPDADDAAVPTATTVASSTSSSSTSSSSSSSTKDYQWEWKDDSGLFVAFYDEDNDYIEQAFKKQPAGVVYKTTGLSFNAKFKTPYEFDFTKMTQYNTESKTSRDLSRGTPSKAWEIAGYGLQSATTTPTTAAATPTTAVADDGAVSSKSKGDLDYPDYWTPRKLDMDFVPIDLGSEEATKTLKDFNDTIKRPVVIHSLHRIQNYSLWPFYALTRKHIADRNKGDAHEMKLFHGARVRQNMDAIQNFGFDMRVAASGLYGVGIYFAVNATYSDNGYVLQNTDLSREMFICRVATGSNTVGKSALRRPPPKKKSDPLGDLYDSVTNSSKPVIMHIVFNNSQAYPEYVVKYT